MKRRYLGIDYGSKKIGLAIGVSEWIAPLKILENRENHKIQTFALEEIVKFIINEKITDVVIGLPVNQFSTRLETLIAQRNKESSLQVKLHFVDEYLSTKISKQNMVDYGVKKSDRSRDDAFSASELLRRFVERE